MITLYLVFWYKYYKIWTKLSRLSTHVKIGIFAIPIAYWGIGMVEKSADEFTQYNVQSNPVKMDAEVGAGGWGGGGA